MANPSVFGTNVNLASKRVRDLDIAYARRAGGERCILFLHGLGCSKESFEAAFNGPFFSEQFTLLAPDLIGHGESSKPVDFSYTLEEQGELVASLLRVLAIEHIAIIAHSMGNVPGLLVTRKALELSGYFCLEGNMTLADCAISARVAKYSEDDFVNKFYPLAPQKFRCRGLLDDPPASPVAFYRSARSLVDWSASDRLLPLYGDLQTPKAYLYGSKSKAPEVIEVLDSADVIEVAGSGHFLMNDNPAKTFGEIASRLAY